MMKSKGFNILCLFLITNLYSQTTVKGKISINENFDSKNEISVYEKNKGFILKVLPNTQFEFITDLNKLELIFSIRVKKFNGRESMVIICLLFIQSSLNFFFVTIIKLLSLLFF